MPGAPSLPDPPPIGREVRVLNVFTVDMAQSLIKSHRTMSERSLNPSAVGVIVYPHKPAKSPRHPVGFRPDEVIRLWMKKHRTPLRDAISLKVSSPRAPWPRRPRT